MNIPNIITCLRIFGTLFLLFVTPFSGEFFIIYSLTGLTDALDGFIARKTNCVTEFGSQLDSVADFIFYSVMIYKSRFVLSGELAIVIWIIIALSVILRIFSYAYSGMKYRRFVPLHTYLNKLTGFSVFVLPYLAFYGFFNYACLVASIIALTASLQELIIHIKSDKKAA